MATISIVIPCFNESEVIPLLYQRLKQICETCTDDLEVLFVDDGSTDDTWSQLAAICEVPDTPDSNVWRAIRLSRNKGHQVALWAGLVSATGDAVFVIDADLQDPPELLPEFLEKWRAGCEVVYGVRMKRKESLLKRFFYSAFYRVLDQIADHKIPRDSGDYCLMDRAVVDAILRAPQAVPFIRGLRAEVGFRQEPLEYERDARAAGKEKYNFRMLFGLAFSGIFGFSKKPLQAISIVGVACLILAMSGIAGAFLIPSNAILSTGQILMCSFFSLLSGAILLAAGALGEYVYRIGKSVSSGPSYVVWETRNSRPVTSIEQANTNRLERDKHLQHQLDQHWQNPGRKAA